MADSNFIDGLKTEFHKLNEPELTALRTDVDALKNKPVAPSPKAYITETWRSGEKWWRRYSDGFIEQGGRITEPNSNNPSWTVTFHKPFTSAGATVNATGNLKSGAGEYIGVAIRSVTTTGASMFSATYGGNVVHWYACGY